MRIRLKPERLVEELATKRLSQNAWARRIGVSRGHLSNLVSGKRPYPSARTQRKLLEALDVPFSELFVIEREEPTPAPPSSRWLDWRLRRWRLRLDRTEPAEGATYGGGTLESMRRELRLALRNLARSPGFAAAGVLSLALGIGASTAVFSIVQASLFAPPPFEDPERLVTLERHSERSNSLVVELGDFLAWRSENTSFEELAILEPTWRPHLGQVQPPRRLDGMRVSGGFFRLLGVQAHRGRLIMASDDSVAGSRVAVVSERLWRGQFGGDPHLIGRRIRLNGEPHTVVGVLPSGFRYWRNRPDVVVPLALDQQNRRERFWPVGRLQEGVSVEAAAGEMTRVHRRAGRGERAASTTIAIETFPDMLNQTRERSGDSLMLMSAAAMLVLLLGCVNLANLMLGRVVSRRKDLAVRASLGASWRQILFASGAEGVLVAAAGGGVALILVGWLIQATEVLTSFQPYYAAVEPDWSVFAFGLGLSAAVALACGLLPSLFGSRQADTGVLRSETVRGEAPGRGRLAQAFVVAELAICLTLLAGASLLVNNLLRLRTLDPGFDYENVTRVEIPMAPERYTRELPMDEESLGEDHRGEPERVVLARHDLFVATLLEEASALPAVLQAEVVSDLTMTSVFLFRAVGSEPTRLPLVAVAHGVTPGFFDLMGIQTVAGRGFRTTDREGAEPVIVIPDSVAKRRWPGENPLGRQIHIDSEPSPRTVVGVTADKRIFGDIRRQRATLYLPFDQLPRSSDIYLGRLAVNLLLKTGKEPPSESQVRGLIEGIDPQQPMAWYGSLADLFSEQIAEERRFTLLLGLLAALGLALGVTGVYAVMSFAVASRTFEFGMRMALGAARRQVVALVLRRALLTVALGTGLGLLGAFQLTTYLESLLYEVEPLDPLSFAIAVVLLLIAAFSASWFPARRAARVDPLEALRHT